MGKVKRYTIKDVQETARQRGDKLISKEYKICTDPLIFECAKEHRFKISYRWYRRNKDSSGCPICRNTNLIWLGIEESILEELYGRLPITGLAKVFNNRMKILNLKTRSVESITEKIYDRFGKTIKPDLDWYTISEFSNRIKISRNVVAAWVRRKDLPITKFGHIMYINPIKFREWIKDKEDYTCLLSKDVKQWLAGYTKNDRFLWQNILIDESDLEMIRKPAALRIKKEEKI